MNTIISKEKLEDILESKDLEIRKIAENIIFENFDTNFNAYVYKNLDKERIEISLDDIHHPLYIYNGISSIKELLKIVVSYPKYSVCYQDVVNVIFEYNDRIRNK